MPQFVPQPTLEDLAEQGLLTPGLSVLRLNGKFPADPIYART